MKKYYSFKRFNNSQYQYTDPEFADELTGYLYIDDDNIQAMGDNWIIYRTDNWIEVKSAPDDGWTDLYKPIDLVKDMEYDCPPEWLKGEVVIDFGGKVARGHGLQRTMDTGLEVQCPYEVDKILVKDGKIVQMHVKWGEVYPNTWGGVI